MENPYEAGFGTPTEERKYASCSSYVIYELWFLHISKATKNWELQNIDISNWSDRQIWSHSVCFKLSGLILQLITDLGSIFCAGIRKTDLAPRLRHELSHLQVGPATSDSVQVLFLTWLN